ncbi:MAG: hypothetical protein AAGE65_09785 [Planctomycetota bacterium]
MAFVVDASAETGRLPHFWKSTGFTPPGLLIDDTSMRVQMAHFDGVPMAGVEWVRVHDLLTLVKVEKMTAATPRYDWSGLDAALDAIRDAGMKPFFEVMGSPQGWTFSDALNDRQVAIWRRFVGDMARHLIERYGASEVRSWYFEVWNEPDVHPWFNHPWAEDDVAGLIRYYDATSAGLVDADPELRFGGPGTAEQLSTMFTGLMKHLDTGTNHLTGQSPPRCDFISIHVKGGDPSPTPKDPSMDAILDGQRELHDYLVEHHPRLAELPLINNECDPLVGWSHDHHWRGGAYYASFVARLIERQLQEAVRGPADFVLMSNDHGFLGGWGRRSVMVPFDSVDDDGASGGVSMVKKPVLEGMAMLSLLGDRTLAASRKEGAAAVTCLASVTSAGDLVLMVTHHDDDSSATGEASVAIEIQHGNPAWSRQTTLRIDAEHTNPRAVWAAAGAPQLPDAEVLHAMREAAEMDADVSSAPAAGESIHLNVPMHGVALVVLSRDPGRVPTMPHGLEAEVVAGLYGPELLVRWEDAGDARKLAGYRVEAVTPTGVVTLSETMPLSTAVVRPLPSGTDRVRVFAVDAWGRVGEAASVPVEHD